jgi:hypothetical protein
MFAVHMVHMKAVMAVITAVMGAAAGGTVINSFTNTATSAGFLLYADPSTLSIVQGSSMVSSITVTSFNGFSGTVALSVHYPNGAPITSSFNPSNVNVPANGNVKSTLTLQASASGQLGNYTIDVIGTSQKKIAATLMIFTVLSDKTFVINVDSSTINTVPGSTSQVTVSVSSMNGFNGTVSLEATVPFGYITVTGGQSPIVLQPSQTITSSLTISTSSMTPLGTYYVTVTGISGMTSNSATVTLVVTDPVVDTESLAMISYTFNSNTNMTLTIQNTGTGTVTVQSYEVRDSSGDTWTFTYNTNAPVIAPGAIVSIFIVIGMGCNGCTYTGITGLFNQFSAGQSYTVTLMTMANHQFAWVVNR